MTLADEDMSSILADGLTCTMMVSSNDGWSLVQILKLIFGPVLIKIVTLKFCRDFEADVWSRFWSWTLINLCYDFRSSYFGERTLPLGMLCHWQCLTTALILFAKIASEWSWVTKFRPWVFLGDSPPCTLCFFNLLGACSASQSLAQSTSWSFNCSPPGTASSPLPSRRSGTSWLSTQSLYRIMEGKGW